MNLGRASGKPRLCPYSTGSLKTSFDNCCGMAAVKAGVDGL